MSNEKFIEEIMYTIHNSGFLNEIMGEVEHLLKINPKSSSNEVIFNVFFRYVKEGKIEY